MAEPPSPVDSLHQAGGGASETQRAIQTISPTVLPHLRHIFELHAGPDKTWKKDQVKTFVQHVQHHGVADSPGDLLEKDELDFNGFLAYMTSTNPAITTPRENEDLTWPLASYYISSSHNTYLSGNQLSSDSTTESYTNVLLRGCRCVEIDVWDGEDTDSEASSDDHEAAPRKSAKAVEKKNKRRSQIGNQIGKFKERLPGSVTTKLKRTSLGQKLGEKVAQKIAPKPVPASDQAGASNPRPDVAVIEPRVLHGYTLTKEIPFRDVCNAIRDSAFTTSDLPVMVSLEVHCGAQQQAIMVSIMKDAWKGFLVTEPAEEVKELPSPGELKRKILVKVKYVPPQASTAMEESEEDDRAPDDSTKKKKKKAPKVVQDLSRLAIFTRGVSFKSLAQPEASMPTHIFSLSEKKVLDYLEKQPAALFKHNKSYLMRAYPSGMRISSSNLNPPVFWNSGTQVVALNWQQTDQGVMLNEGMFAGTGGWVLKPEGYRPDLNSKTSPNAIIRKTLTLGVTFLAAQGIPLPHDDRTSKSFRPYIKMELHVDGCAELGNKSTKTDGHEQEGEYKARTKTSKGRDLDLGGEQLEFKQVPGLVEELTFLRFTVRDNEIGRDDLAAWACVRLDRLGQGYRFIHLTDSKGTLTEGVVLVKVEKTLV